MKQYVEAGRTYHRLTAIRQTGHYKSRAIWLFRCSCGQERTFRAFNVACGHTKSCGCYRIDVSRERFIIHGLHGSDVYRHWRGMIDRCEQPTNAGYKDYGARGIMVCARWHNIENFIADVGPRPSPRHTLDRKDNNGHYEPGNCRWATPRAQNRNKRNSLFVEFAGRNMPLMDACELAGVQYNFVYYRLRQGLSFEEAVAKVREDDALER